MQICDVPEGRRQRGAVPANRRELGLSEHVFARAKILGARVIRDMEETDYGSRGFSVTDAEGNRWSFGTYAGSE